jgi:hypothetical protein
MGRYNTINDKICRLYEDGYYYTELANKFNLDRRTIKKIVTKKGCKRRGILNRSVYTVNDVYFNKCDNKSMWLVGLLAADGWVKKNGIGIAQSGDNGLKMIEYIKNELNYSGPIYSSTTTNEISYSIYVTNHKIVTSLSKYNIIPKKSLVYKLPKIDSLLFKSFIRGYIDGDGSIGVYDNGAGYHSLVISFVGTKEFVDEVSELIPIPYSNKLNKHTINCWELRWYGKKAYDLGLWLYSEKNLFKSKKYDIFADYNPKIYKASIYEEKKLLVKKLLDENNKVSEISKITKVPFQTIYEWKKKF